MSITADQLDSYRKALSAERLRVLHNIASFHEEFGKSLSDLTEENGIETHLGDQGTVTFLRERDLTIEEHEENLLNEIDAAISRLDAGTFGTCSDCGVEIPPARLEALPYARRCIGCQERAGA